MQTGAASLPVVHSNVQKNLPRKENLDLKDVLQEAKVRSPLKNTTYLPSYRKSSHSILGGPYKSNAKQQSSSDHSKNNKTSVSQRVLSAKMLRLKQLQNQLADAHYHLNELANENRLLKALQKRQDTALKRYEGANAELPRIINSHHEELRVLQIKYKKLKALHKETCDQLKEKDSEIQSVQSQNKHLLRLSKDRNLQEREKLQMQVSDLTYRIQQQQETIQGLQRKLSLETKSLKQQLQTEVSKRKEAQKNLEQAMYKLRSLENLLDNRERRLYHNGQLQVPAKNARLGTQSLTNLRDISSLNTSKLPAEEKDLPKSEPRTILSFRIGTNRKADDEVQESEKLAPALKTATTKSFTTETMASLQQVRKYRLQRSSHLQRRAQSANDVEDDSEEATAGINKSTIKNLDLDDCESTSTGKCSGRSFHQDQDDLYPFEKLYENQNYSNCDDTVVDMHLNHNYISDNVQSEDENTEAKVKIYLESAMKSRALHSRLINSATEVSREEESELKLGETLEEQKPEIHSGIATMYSESKILNKLSTSNGAVRKGSSEGNSESNHQLKDNDNGPVLESFDSLQSETHHSQTGIEGQHTETLSTLSSAYELTGDISRRSSKHLDSLKNDVNNEDQYKTIPEYKDLASADATGFSISDSHAISTETSQINEKHQEKEEEEINADLPIEVSFDKNSGGSDINQKELINRESYTSNVNTINRLNMQDRSVEVESVEALPSNIQYTNYKGQHQFGSLKEVNTTSKHGDKTKAIKYNKEKLLATMRAIDNNENIEFISKEYHKHNPPSRRQITENLYHGVPTHTKAKQDIISDIFSTDRIDNKSAEAYSKLH